MQEPPVIFPVNLITHNKAFFDIPPFVTFSWVATIIIVVVAFRQTPHQDQTRR